MNIPEKAYHISPIKLLSKISFHLEKNRKKQTAFVLILSFLSSLAESVSIAMLIPFLNFFINPENYKFNDFFIFIFDFFNLNENNEILIITTILFVLIVAISGFVRINYIKRSNQLIDTIASDFRIKIFNFLLNQDYSYYFKFGSQEILSNITQKTGAFTTIIFSAINIFNAILISLAILIVLFINEPIYTPIIIFFIILFFLITFKRRSFLVLEKGQKVNLGQNKIIDIFENAVGYLPEIIIYDLKKIFYNFLSTSSKEVAKSSAEIRTIAQTPRIYLEVYILVFVVLIVFFLNFNEQQIENNITYLAILAFGSQKTLPLINSIYQLSVNFKSSVPIVMSYLNILENNSYKLKPIIENKSSNKKFNFLKNLEIKNLSFSYDKNKTKILNNLSFTIKKGQKIMIKGKTGSGKSTLVNIILGLLEPQEGKLIVDGQEVNLLNKYLWQKNFAIVPQVVFLSDNSILENITIGLEENKIDFNQLKFAVKNAQLDDFIEKLPNKFSEKVGEKGVRLSGGQRQRIGIARALYRGANIIILDEPTNSLDMNTEKLVMDSILSLNKNVTLIMISHSNKLSQKFDQIIDLDSL